MADHWTHPDPAVRELIAEAEARAQLLGRTEVLAVVVPLGQGWIGFDDSHVYGDALLTELSPFPTP